MIWIALLFLALTTALIAPPLVIGLWLSARVGFYFGCASLILISLAMVVAFSDLIYCTNAQIVGWESENHPIFDRECGTAGFFIVIVLITTAPIVVILSAILMMLRSQVKRQQLASRSH